MLQIFSPMGHALGLSVVSARLDDLALGVLFGSVYADMRDWMGEQQRHWTGLLEDMQRQVQQALDACPELAAGGAVACVSTRAKSAYSLMKKLATLSGTPLPSRAVHATWGKPSHAASVSLVDCWSKVAVAGLLRWVAHAPSAHVCARSSTTTRWYRCLAAAGIALMHDGRPSASTARRLVLVRLYGEPVVLGAIVLVWQCACLVPSVSRLVWGADFSCGGKALDETYDVLGMRIIVEGRGGVPLPEAAGRDACYAVERVVGGLWTVIQSRRKDYIAKPKSNGYQSLHLAVEVPANLRRGAGAGAGAARGGRVTAVEVQVRTSAMHAAAEEGIAAHISYKSGMDVQQSTRLHEWTQQLMQARSVPPTCAPAGAGRISARTAAHVCTDQRCASRQCVEEVLGVTSGAVCAGIQRVGSHDLD